MKRLSIVLGVIAVLLTILVVHEHRAAVIEQQRETAAAAAWDAPADDHKIQIPNAWQMAKHLK